MTEDEQNMIRELNDLEIGLSGWEMDFISDLENTRWNSDLTERQHDTLQRLADKYA